MLDTTQTLKDLKLYPQETLTLEEKHWLEYARICNYIKGTSHWCLDQVDWGLEFVFPWNHHHPFCYHFSHLKWRLYKKRYSELKKDNYEWLIEYNLSFKMVFSLIFCEKFSTQQQCVEKKEIPAGNWNFRENTTSN